MNKKQEMVSELITRLENANVDIGYTVSVIDGVSKVDCKMRSYLADYWTQYPDGYANDHPFDCDSSVEAKLARLDEDSLKRILSNDYIKEGAKFDDVWKTWGSCGYFKCVPKILDVHGIPVFRMRHDVYLYMNSQKGFSICRDAYGSDVRHSSESAVYMEPMISRCGGTRTDDIFRKAVFLSYAMNACCNVGVFDYMLDNYSDLFDSFLAQVDEKQLQWGTDCHIGVDYIKAAASRESVPTGKEYACLVLADKYRKNSAFGSVRFGDTYVSYRASKNGKPVQYTFRFPAYNTIDKKVHREDYLCYCWIQLMYTLFGLAGVHYGYDWISSDKADYFDGSAFGAVLGDSVVSSVPAIFKALDTVSRFG